MGRYLRYNPTTDLSEDDIAVSPNQAFAIGPNGQLIKGTGIRPDAVQGQVQSQPNPIPTIAGAAAGKAALGGGVPSAAAGTLPNGLQTLPDGSILMADGSTVGPGMGAMGGIGVGGLAAGGLTGMKQLSGAGKILNGQNPSTSEKVALALPTFGLSLIPGLSSLFGSDRYLSEYNRAEALRKQGVNWGFNTAKPTSGRSKEELVKIAQDTGGNVKFAQSRNEKDLTGTDIQGYSALPEKLGADYANLPAESRATVAQLLLDAGAVREHHGTIDVAWTPELEQKAKDAIKSIASQPATTSQSGAGSKIYLRKYQPRTTAAKPAATKKEKAITVPTLPQEAPKLLLGAAYTTNQGGPSPYQPQVVTPEQYSKLLSDIYTRAQANKPKPLDYLYG